METETLYKKVGRKYVPVEARWYDDRETMKVDTFKLTYAYSNGGRRYEYDVIPSTAPMVAAMLIARKAMEDAIQKSSSMRPNTPQKYTTKQLQAIDRFKAEMGGMYPSWWIEGSAYEISEAAIKAVLNYKP